MAYSLVMAGEQNRVAGFLELLRWLGPWSPDTRVPAGVARERVTLREGSAAGPGAVPGVEPEARRLVAHVYRHGRSCRGVFVVVPGLHFLGPEDPRLDRFCRILARAGLLVVCPGLPAFLDLRVHPSTADDLETTVEWVLEQLPSGLRPSLFSISFGSSPALEVAARMGERIDGVLTFGGYESFSRTARFCASGKMESETGLVDAPYDPLNAPALFVNLLPHLEGDFDRPALAQAWRTMAHRTWGRVELKRPGARDPIAARLAADLPTTERELFLTGCGLGQGAPELVDEGLRRAGPWFDFARPRAAIARLECPVGVLHGRDDDVIPWAEAVALERRLARVVPTRLYLTGLFAHTGSERPGADAAIAEGRTLLGMAWAIAHGGALRELFHSGSRA